MSPKTIFILHDSFGGPLQEWIPWLRMTLEQAGHKVIVPNFPTPIGQSLDSWHVALQSHAPEFTKDTIVIGYGTGGTLWLRELEKEKHDILASIFVATPVTPSPHVGYAKVNESFILKPFDFEAIKQNGGGKAILFGTQDPLVSSGDGELLASQIGIDPIIIEGGQHFTVGSGYTQFIQLADLITTIISPKKELPPEPKPTQTEEPKQDNTTPALVHSYYKDMARAMKSNEGSVMSKVLEGAREKKEVLAAKNPAQPKNIFFILLSLLLLVLSAGIIGYLVTLLPDTSPASQTSVYKYPSLIRKNAETIIDLAGKEPYVLEDIVRTNEAVQGNEGTLRDTVFIDGVSRLSFKTAYTKITGREVPMIISSYIDSPWMYGSWYPTNTFRETFMIIQVKSYDGIFSGLRSWESTLPQDLGIFFGLPKTLIDNPNRYQWQDVLVENRTLRKLMVTPEKSIIGSALSTVSTKTTSTTEEKTLYTGFLSDTMLVITTDPGVFTELARRQSDQQFLR